MEAKYFLLLCPARKLPKLICNTFTHNSDIWHPTFSTTLQNQIGSPTSTYQSSPYVCTHIFFQWLWMQIYYSIIIYMHNAYILFYVNIMHIYYTSLKKYFAIFYCVNEIKRSSSTDLWYQDVTCSFKNLGVFLSVNSKKEQKPLAPPKASAHCLANGGIL